MTSLRLVAAAPTPAQRRAQFGGDEFGGDQHLDEGGRNAAQALRGTIGRADHWSAGPSPAARQTAHALGGRPVIEPALADVHYGDWTGHTLEQIATTDPPALRSWLSDPDTVPPGGESLTALRRRVGAWLDSMTTRPDTMGHRLVAVAPATVVRAALAHALDLPPAGIWQLDVAPLSVTRLRHRTGRWHLHL